ncbi:ABC transporter permease [Hathewaya limosa]|uniref:Sulfonate transport system permease protein n=1 Tax=Hathewaya limosa TaxID=1536 RepID=A0ABU0JV18_HATLI|nr:ABC transporter permease [Hathewaya limosa]MDQ0480949.1 sulfonate transport system permease protein [Hathewaya limosa]
MVILLIIVFLWILGSNLSWWSIAILPTPKMVIGTFYNMFIDGSLFTSIGISILRIFIGFIITFLVAIPLGIFFGLNPKIYKKFNLLLEMLRHIPPLALIPLIILWFGIGEKSKVIIIILASFFPLFMNTLDGVKNCDQKLIEVGKTLNFSKDEIFMKILIPCAFPNIILGIKLALGYSWRAIIGAEMIAASSGIGYLILDGQELSRPDVVMVGIILIGSLGLLTDYIFERFTKGLRNSKGNIENNGI